MLEVLHIENIAVFVLRILLGGGLSGFDLLAFFQRRFQLLALCFRRGGLRLKCILTRLDLRFHPGQLAGVGFDQRQFLRAIAAHRLLQSLQAVDGILRGRLFRVQRRDLHPDGRQPFSQAAALLRRDALSVR